jgi:hypothetical protein
LAEQNSIIKIRKPGATTALEYYSQNVLNRVSAREARVIPIAVSRLKKCNFQ